MDTDADMTYKLPRERFERATSLHYYGKAHSNYAEMGRKGSKITNTKRWGTPV